MYDLADREMFQKFMALCQTPEAAQQELLMDIMETNKDTAIGKLYNFAGIHSIADFQSKVPVSSWENIQDMAKAMEQGKKDQLFAGQPEHFIVTSGTTGTCKFIPESTLGSKAKSITSRLRRISLAVNNPACLSGKVFAISNSAGIGKVACGIPYGYASGMTLMETPAALRNMIAYPVELLNIQDQEALDYALMRCAIEQDVSAIIGNNAGRMEQLIFMAQRKATTIIKDIRQGTLSQDIALESGMREEIAGHLRPNPERADALQNMLTSGAAFTPASYWPNLALVSCWLGGSVGRYLRGLTPLLGKDVAFVDFGYGASEGKFNIPLTNDQAAGPLSLPGAFYEFEAMDDSGDIFLAHQLEEGKRYKLLITTFSGLYRYDLHDIVGVRGCTGKTPNIYFINKTNDVGNICGEKLSAHELMAGIATCARKHGCKVHHFCAIPDVEAKRYDLCIELDENSAIPQHAFVTDMDTELKKGVVYAAKRTQELLFSPRIVLMKQGWQDALYAEKIVGGVSIAQIKLPVIYGAIPLQEYMSTCIE